MSIKKKIAYSLLINVIIYLVAGFLPCSSGGFLSFCSGEFFHPIGVVVAALMQFGAAYTLVTTGRLPDMGPEGYLLGIILWLVVLSPFYIERIKAVFRRKKVGRGS